MGRGGRGNSPESNRKIWRSLAMIGQFGFQMLVPILLCTFVGLFLDRHFGTSFMTVALFFLGSLAGGRNIYRMAKRIFGEDKDTDDG